MNKHAQQGLTTIGWIAVIGIFSMIVVTGFKVLPMYLEFFQIRSVMDSVAIDEEIDVRSKNDLWTAISKRLIINQVKVLTKENFTFERNKDQTTISVNYEVRKPYVAQLFLGANFSYAVVTTR
ncbi:MAG: DUF4845 domain-containing protein [Gammaproteobacteria bacterium]|nr:DUF4845 domain-containing protein [Gammaproteobacteria bacterium]MBL6998899.1 DUF4845 domain-containing protein [Gammaproteobacteria bacterium]